MTACPSEDELLDLLDDRLREQAAASLRLHLDRCAECHAAVAALARIGSDARPAVQAWPGEGEVVAGRYAISKRLGEGAAGVVFEALDTQLQRPVALKLIRVGGAQSRRHAEQRLERESRTMAQLRHPNVVTVYDMGVNAEHMFVAMELISGTNLRHWCRNERTVAQIVAVFQQAAAGLQAAHAAGIVHRDFKPDNVLVDDGGAAFVGDFGLAAEVGVSQPSMSSDDDLERSMLSQTGLVVGTPAYLSPEAWRGEAVDARADVFAFCVSLHEALYGRRPHDASSLASLRDAVQEGKLSFAPPTRAVRRRLRNRLRAGLSPEPDERPSLAEMRDAMRGPSPARKAVVLGLVVAAPLAAGWSMRSTTAAEAPPAPSCDAQAVASLSRSAQRSLDRFIAAAEPSVVAKVEAAVQEFRDGWRDTSVDVCQLATERPPADVDLRTRCLERAWIDFEGRVAALLDTDNPLAVMRRFPVARRCLDDKLPEIMSLPDDASRDAVIAMWAELSRLQARQEVGSFAEVEQDLEALVERARAAGSRQLEAECLYVLGSGHQFTGEFERARGLLIEAANAAVSAGYDVPAAQSWNSLTYLSIERFDDLPRAEEYLSYAKAATARMGNTALAVELRTQSLYHEGLLRVRQQRWRDATRAIDAGMADAIEGQPDLVPMFEDLRALALSERGDIEPALLAARRALAIRVEQLGVDSPYVAFSHNLIAGILSQVGRDEETLVELRAARRIMTRAFGESNAQVSSQWQQEATVLASLGRFDEARAALRQCESSITEDERSDAWRAELLSTQSHVASQAGDHAGALGYAQQYAVVAARVDPTGETDQWLARTAIAIAQYGLGRVAEAEQFADAWFSGEPRHALAYQDAATVTRFAVDVYVARARWADITRLVEPILGGDMVPAAPERAALEMALCRAYVARGRAALAARVASEALAHLVEAGETQKRSEFEDWLRGAGVEPA
ncbi:MAG: serine/threonine-protein kinase [Myxococcota bacterium]